MENSDVPVTFWRELKDTKTNNAYYWNPETNQTLWTLPENAVITSEASERSDKITDPENEEETPNDLVKAYNHYSKSFLNTETGEADGCNGIKSSQDTVDEETLVTANSTPTNKKNKKGKKQVNTQTYMYMYNNMSLVAMYCVHECEVLRALYM